MTVRRRPHIALSVSSSHWREDGQPKVRYGSRAEALSAAADQTADSGLRLGVYQCDYCSGWHMGRQLPRTER